MKKSLKIVFAAGLCTVFALTLTFCGSKPETAEQTGDTTVVVEPTPADTTAADTTVVDTTAVK